MSDKVQGRIRESADGLQSRDHETEKARLREAQQHVAEEAAARRESDVLEDGDRGD